MTADTHGSSNLGLVVVLGLICGFGVLSNVLVLVVITLNKKLRGVTEYFLANLAVSDLILAGVAIPLQLSQASDNHHFSGGNIGCKLVMFLPLFTIMASISTMVAISFDRYFVIVHGRKLGQRLLVAVILLIWLLSLATSGPQLYEYSLYEKQEGANETVLSCGSHGIEENFETIYAGIVVFLCYLLPLVILIVNYTLIGVHLWKVSNKSGQQGAVSKHKTSIIKMLATVAVVFAILWAPFFSLFTMEEVTGTDDTSEASSALHVAKQLMVALSTVSNPVLYCLFNRHFRAGAHQVLCCNCCRETQVSPYAGSTSNPTNNTTLTQT